MGRSQNNISHPLNEAERISRWNMSPCLTLPKKGQRHHTDKAKSLNCLFHFLLHSCWQWKATWRYQKQELKMHNCQTLIRKASLWSFPCLNKGFPSKTARLGARREWNVHHGRWSSRQRKSCKYSKPFTQIALTTWSWSSNPSSSSSNPNTTTIWFTIPLLQPLQHKVSFFFFFSLLGVVYFKALFV